MRVADLGMAPSAVALNAHNMSPTARVRRALVLNPTWLVVLARGVLLRLPMETTALAHDAPLHMDLPADVTAVVCKKGVPD